MKMSKDYFIDWRLGGTYKVTALNEEEAEDQLFANIEKVIREATGWNYKGIEIDDITEDNND